jgi:hypothetical protein
MNPSQQKQVSGTRVLKKYNPPRLEVYGRLLDLTANNNKSAQIDNPSGKVTGTN